MIKVTGNEDLTVFYECSCGVKGQCMIKPLSDSGVIVSEISCPLCLASERIEMTRGNERGELSWGCVVYNEVTDYELKENLDD